MSVFWFLHRLVIAAFWVFWLVVALFVWRHRAELAPVWDMAELAWNYKPAREVGPARLEGRGTRAYSGNGFELRDAKGVAFNYGLAGVASVRGDAGSPKDNRAFVEGARSNLQQIIAGRPVVIEVLVSHAETRTGLGVARIGDTNVNVLALAQGFGPLQRDQIRSLPLGQQWEFLRAERAARLQGLGVWQSNLVGLRLPE